MEFFASWLKENQGLLKTVLKFAQGRGVKLYLVGGVLRDIFLGREKENPDFDFCLKKGAINFSRLLARELSAGFVALDEIHGCGRVVKKLKGKIYTLDFSDFRGKDLADDLLHRDFSINAMAVELDKLFSGRHLSEILIDPYSGRKDLNSGLIRMINRHSFDEDPLRILRSFSLACLFNLKISAQTLKAVKAKKNKLSKVSCERIRDEIFKILSCRRSYEFLIQLDRHRILDLIIPEIENMRKMKKRSKFNLDVWGHSLESAKKIELITDSLRRDAQIEQYLKEEISSGRRRLELIKLATLLHDLGKPKTFRVKKGKVTFYGHDRLGGRMVGDIAARLRLSNEETQILKKTVALHLRPGFLVTNPLLTPRARFRFFRDAGGEAVSVLLVSLADERATKGYLILDKIRKRYERVIPKLMREYFLRQQEESPRRLIDGNDLLRHFKLKPSPLIGKILTELEELQAIGRIRTKAAGFEAAAKIIKNTSKRV
jgi:poly(A) polymerase